MRKMIIAMSVLLFITGCGQKVDVSSEKAAIQSVMNQYVSSIEKEDMKLYGKIMAHDPSIMCFGAFGDPIVGWDNVKKVIGGQNEALSATKIEQSDVDIHVSPSGKSAWATSLWQFRTNMGEQKLDLPIRCTWVFEKKDKKWVIVHWHKSVAVG